MMVTQNEHGMVYCVTTMKNLRKVVCQPKKVYIPLKACMYALHAGKLGMLSISPLPAKGAVLPHMSTGGIM